MSPDGNAASLGARSVDAARARVLLLRAAATFAVLAVWQLSGASAYLLSGLDARFNGAWFAVHAAYFLVIMLGIAVLLLPFSLYEDFILDARERGGPTEFDGWTFNILRGLAFDVGVGIAFFLAIYGLIEALPRAWSVVAAVLYAAISALLSMAPLLQGPAEDELAELRDPALRARLNEIFTKLRVPPAEALRWHGADADDQAMLALQGFGKRRRVIISDAMLREFTHDEIAALLAHETAHIRNADVARFNLLNLVAALLCFPAAHLLCRAAAAQGYPAVNDLASFPLLACALLAFSLVGLPLLNAFTRAREYIADAVAARTAGEIPLRSAIEKLNNGGPQPAPDHPFDILLNPQPAHHHRLWRIAQKR